MAAGDIVLITGSTGHIGFRVLRYALEYGYQVRAAVRSEAKARAVASNPALKAMNVDSQLSFVVVPDFLAPGAFDEAVKGVKYIIHVASPIADINSNEDPETKYIQPAVQGTLGVFRSAQNEPSVKRIVVTSSVVVIIPITAMFVEPVDEVFDAESRVPNMQGPYPNAMIAYAASKIPAFNAATRWIEEEKPAFDVINIHPSFVEGRDDSTFTTAGFHTGTNKWPLDIALSNKHEAPTPNNVNHVDDAARVHVLALDPKVKGNQSFITSSSGQDGMEWDDAKKYIAKHFPNAVKQGILPNNGHIPTLIAKIDSSKTEETFGFKHKSYEEMVVSVIAHYLELLEKEQSQLKN